MPFDRIAYDRARDKKKTLARGIIRQLIYFGRLSRGSCSCCGRPDAEAHHEDYSKPRVIVWLCRQHHADVHSGKLLVRPEWRVFIPPQKADCSNRQTGPKPAAALSSQCRYGHEYTDENTRLRTRNDGLVERVCLTCQRKWGREHMARKRASAAIAAKGDSK